MFGIAFSVMWADAHTCVVLPILLSLFLCAIVMVILVLLLGCQLKLIIFSGLHWVLFKGVAYLIYHTINKDYPIAVREGDARQTRRRRKGANGCLCA